MDAADDIGLGQRQQIVVAFEGALVVDQGFPTEIFFGEPMLLNHCTHGTIEYEDALIGSVLKCTAADGGLFLGRK